MLLRKFPMTFLGSCSCYCKFSFYYINTQINRDNWYSHSDKNRGKYPWARNIAKSFQCSCRWQVRLIFCQSSRATLCYWGCTDTMIVKHSYISPTLSLARTPTTTRFHLSQCHFISWHSESCCKYPFLVKWLQLVAGLYQMLFPSHRTISYMSLWPELQSHPILVPSQEILLLSQQTGKGSTPPVHSISK